jgi:hypothetical protein
MGLRRNGGVPLTAVSRRATGMPVQLVIRVPGQGLVESRKNIALDTGQAVARVLDARRRVRQRTRFVLEP